MKVGPLSQTRGDLSLGGTSVAFDALAGWWIHFDLEMEAGVEEIEEEEEEEEEEEVEDEDNVILVIADGGGRLFWSKVARRVNDRRWQVCSLVIVMIVMWFEVSFWDQLICIWI